MEVIPVINCGDKTCLEARFAVLPSLGSEWVHVDVSDGKFAPTRSWGSPQEIKDIIARSGVGSSLEVHLMVDRPEEVVEDWLKAGVKRVIVHIESFPFAESPRVHKVIEKCAEYGAEIMFALKIETDVSEIFPYLEYTMAVQCLAVPIGPSGGKMNDEVIKKIRALRERVPDLTIEIDGGINPETALRVKEAGADIVTSASYIFESKDPKQAYETLFTV